jgi:hypothetical protein
MKRMIGLMEVGLFQRSKVRKDEVKKKGTPIA